MFPEIMLATWANLFFLCLTTQFLDRANLKDSIKEALIEKNLDFSIVYLVSGSLVLTAFSYL